MKFKLYKKAILKTDIPKYKLKKGDVVTLVKYSPKSVKFPKHYAAEIFTPTGESLGVCSLAVNEIDQINQSDS